MSWEDAAKEVRQALDAAIPVKWKLQRDPITPGQDVSEIPRNCSLLSPEQIRITEQPATQLVGALVSGEVSSTQVVEAFCAKAAIAHQLVSIPC
jgi:amidase